jgi:tetratricopeptide (TPR) repeat protein
MKKIILVTAVLSLLSVCLITTLNCKTSAQNVQKPTYEQIVSEAQSKGAAKEWAAAVLLWERVIEMNPHLARNWISYANALYEAKAYRKAITAYEKWNELGASYPWDSTYNIACCYALLGEKEKALQWLEKALNMGYRNLRHAQTDSDFESLRNDPKYRELVGLVDTSKWTRLEGWRYDIQFLAREIKRIHYDPFKKVSEKDFDAYVKKLSDDVAKLTDAQLIVALYKLAKMPGDGHTSVRNAPQFQKQLPVQFYLFAEGLFITAAAPEQAELAGAQVVKIGETPVEKVIDMLDPLISRDNTIWIKFVAPNFMRNPILLNGLGIIPDTEKANLTVRDASGNTRTVTLTAAAGQPLPTWATARKDATNPEPLYLKNRRTPYWYEYLPDSKTVFFQYNQVANKPDESLTVFCEKLFKFINENDVERLVIDMRWNGGGNNFLNRPLVQGLIRNEKINKRGKLFVIVGRNTFSAAMNGATEIEQQTNAIFAGEPTGSAPNFVGETIGFELPYSKLSGSISDLYWQKSVAMDYRTWIAPQIYAPPSFELFKANRDPAMDAIQNYKENQ